MANKNTAAKARIHALWHRAIWAVPGEWRTHRANPTSGLCAGVLILCGMADANCTAWRVTKRCDPCSLPHARNPRVAGVVRKNVWRTFADGVLCVDDSSPACATSATRVATSGGNGERTGATMYWRRASNASSRVVRYSRWVVRRVSGHWCCWLGALRPRLALLARAGLALRRGFLLAVTDGVAGVGIGCGTVSVECDQFKRRGETKGGVSTGFWSDGPAALCSTSKVGILCAPTLHPPTT